MIALLNKYKFYIIIAILLSWILFFAQYDVFTIISKRQELKEMNDKIAFLKTEIINTEKQQAELKINPKEIEKQSRERYFMKKDDEDVFIFDTILQVE